MMVKEEPITLGAAIAKYKELAQNKKIKNNYLEILKKLTGLLDVDVTTVPNAEKIHKYDFDFQNEILNQALTDVVNGVDMADYLDSICNNYYDACYINDLDVSVVAEDIWCDAIAMVEINNFADTIKKVKNKLYVTPDYLGFETTDQNLKIILDNDTTINHMKYNSLVKSNEIQSTYWSNFKKKISAFDRDKIRNHLLLYYKFKNLQKNKVNDVIDSYCADHAYNPLLDYIHSVPEWDGTKRVETLFIDYLGADDTPYNRYVTKLFFEGMYARAVHPGCTFQYMLIATGVQNIGKSTVVNSLMPFDSLYIKNLQISEISGSNSKAGLEKIQDGLVCEFQELTGMSKADDSALKAFITTDVDKYRAAYARDVEEYPRHVVLYGTYNDDKKGILHDPTGGRRYLIVECKARTRDVKYLDKDQFWAELKTLYHGQKLIFDEEKFGQDLKKVQEDLSRDDPNIDVLFDYLEEQKKTEKCPKEVCIRDLCMALDLEISTAKTTYVKQLMMAFPEWEYISQKKKFAGRTQRYYRLKSGTKNESEQ